MSVDLDKVVRKALEKKPPKLLKAEADKRILMLERQHMNSTAMQILTEVEKLRSGFPDLRHIDEIWFVETMFYGRNDVMYFFSHDAEGKTIGKLGFSKGKVHIRWDQTMPYATTE